MNFVTICLHCLDMRDFHSHLRDTPFLNKLRRQSDFVPTGRAQGHNQGDSLNAEITGIWTARTCDSRFTHKGFQSAGQCRLPTTIIEYLQATATGPSPTSDAADSTPNTAPTQSKGG